ncbi:MAG: peptidyl-prolyl cis-trans isomerase-like 1 [Parcubacteria group bacterium Gr01-1014_66]|nr:MAG: peptidyl-prolyl cis-trans isomerase-like 1 [Parcubacteria group bacterium Gr01-1014_66]
MKYPSLTIFFILLFVVVAIAVFGGRIGNKGEQAESLPVNTEKEVAAGLESLEKTEESSDTVADKTNHMHIVILNTNFGAIEFETYDADAPKTVDNFLKLAHDGFYKNLIFHRVIEGFMIQGGDPKGNGTGGPGYEFADELNPESESGKIGYKKGIVAMANRGPNTNGSQFFIMLEDTPLPYQYTIFGKVSKGQDIVDRIGRVKTDANDKPFEPVVITSVDVREK